KGSTPTPTDKSKLIDPPTAVFISLPSTFSLNQTAILEHATEIAVALWTAECAFCPIDALSVLRIHDQFLIRTELLQTLEMWQTSPLYPLFADKRISSFRVLIGQTPLFTEVSVNDS